MIRTLGLTFTWIFLALACTSKSNDVASVDMRAATSDVIRSNPTLEPTRPEGGLVRGRTATLSAEENAERVARNKKQPIVWGESVAGITMATEYLDGLDILAEPLGFSQGFYFYNENIRIAWGTQTKRTPTSVIVDVGYQGPLSLPAEFGEVRMGDSFKSRFPFSDPTGKEFIKALSRALEKMGPDFDCFSINVCKINVGTDLIEFSFRNGSVLFSNDANHELRFLYFLPNLPPLTTPLTQPMVFGDSAGGANMGLLQAHAKLTLGTPAFTNGIFSYWDNGNLGIAWEPGASKPLMMHIDRGYQGTWVLPAPLGTLRLNQVMSSYFPTNDSQGVELLKIMGRIFDGKAEDASYDCQLVNSCRVVAGDSGIEFIFDKGGVVFDYGPEYRLATVYYTRPQPPRTEPMTTPVNFPTGVAGITMTTSQVDAWEALGEPRRIANLRYYYDNDNIQIFWTTGGPPYPLFIQVNKGHRGPVSLPTGNVLMGTNMSAHFTTVNEDGKVLIRTWSRAFRNEADQDYDCIAEATCKIVQDNTLIYFLFKNMGFFAFGKDDKKELLYIGFDPAQGVATE